MARIKQGVFSWEDVLVQRYQSKWEFSQLTDRLNSNKYSRHQATSHLPSHVAAVLSQYGSYSLSAIYYPGYPLSFAS